MKFDSMTSQKQMLWYNQNRNFNGNVYYSKVVDIDFEMSAKKALFYQIISYISNFKYLIAHFFYNKFYANIQTQLINSTFRTLFDDHIVIRLIIFDGVDISTYNK